jgi:hypothetical protein
VGFWHPGMHGVYNPSSLVNHEFVAKRVLYTCDVCNRNFKEIEDLRRHRFEAHPTRQPLLLIRGRPVGGTPLKVQSALSPEDVVIEDCGDCTLDGKTITPNALRLHLADATSAFHVVRLLNDGAQSKVELDFQVAKVFDLSGVEHALVRLASQQRLTLDAISHFIAECRDYPTGISYCDGIAHYLYGVMAKEQLPGTALERDSYVARYSQSVDQLTDINRAMARSIRALVAFHFNHFLDAESLAPDGALKHAAGAFAGLLDGLPWHFDEAFDTMSRGVVEDLFTDQITLEILRDASKGLSSLKWMTDALQTSLVKTAVGYDKSKRLLLTVEALSHREEAESIEAAKKLLRQLSTQEFFRTWCDAVLRRIKTHER